MLDLLTKSDALISDCGKYRYSLSRTWGEEKPAVFVMLNPSTADASADDPTIRRCIGFAKKWGCGGLIVVNLFAFRATNPKDMKAAYAPEGPYNKWHVKNAAYNGSKVVCAWGTHGVYDDQGAVVLDWLREDGVTTLCLGTTKHGHPKHPLYLPNAAELQPYPSLKETGET